MASQNSIQLRLVYAENGKFGVLTLSHRMCPSKQNADPKLVILVSFYFLQEKLPSTLIPIIASTYGKYAIPFFSGPPCIYTAAVYPWRMKYMLGKLLQFAVATDTNFGYATLRAFHWKNKYIALFVSKHIDWSWLTFFLPVLSTLISWSSHHGIVVMHIAFYTKSCKFYC